jgi:hypothetical protein
MYFALKHLNISGVSAFQMKPFGRIARSSSALAATPAGVNMKPTFDGSFFQLLGVKSGFFAFKRRLSSLENKV